MTLQSYRNGLLSLRMQQLVAREKIERAYVALSKAPTGTDLEPLRQNLQSLREVFAGLRTNEISLGETISPQEQVAQLNGEIPILLMPLRIQTRFDPENASLLVRVYPDDISVDTYEPRLTPSEQAAGKQLWEADPTTSSGHALWRGIVTRFSLNRAVWIMRATNPGAPSQLETVDQPLKVPASWTLPERLVFRFYGESDQLLIHEIVGAVIPDGLEMGIDPARPGQSFQRQDGELNYPSELLWQTDFSEAIKVGMGISVPLNIFGGRRRIERLVVLGVRLSTDERHSADLLAKLIASHSYTDGFSIIPQGTPTNITSDSEMPAAPDADATLDWLNGPGAYPDDGRSTLYEDECDGMRLGHAFGIPPETLRHITGADCQDGREAIAMKRALWAGTLGYFIQQMLPPALSSDGVERAILATRFYFTNFVFGRGPLPAIRAGSQPYGVLPVSADLTLPSGSSLPAWGESTIDVFLQTLHAKMSILAPGWLNLVPQLPRAGAGANANARLLDVLASQASSVEFHSERLIGEEYRANYVDFQQVAVNKGDPLAPDITGRYNAFDKAFPTLLPEIARVLELSFFGGFWSRIVDALGKEVKQLDRGLSPLLNGDVIDNFPFSEIRGINPAYPNYIAWLASRRFEEIRRGLWHNNAKGESEPVTALLYMVLRHSLLYEHAFTAMRFYLGNRINSVTSKPYQWADFAEKDVYNLYYILDTTYWDYLQMPDSAGWPLGAPTPVAGPVLEIIQNRESLKATAPDWKTYLGDIDETYRAFQLFSAPDFPTARLERLFAEHIDLSSYRLDAWLTGYAYQRLLASRVWAPENRGDRLNPLRTAPGEVPLRRYDLNNRPLGPYSEGIYLGAYGWVEGIEAGPVPSPVNDLPSELKPKNARTVTRDADNYGLIHAPSINHAITAAMLRSASVTQPDTTAYNIDLSSARTREALWMIGGVRNGQSLAALLGYRFERALRNSYPALQQYLPNLRNAFPLPRQTDTDTGPSEAIPAHDVVNGLLIVQSRRDGSVTAKLQVSLGFLPPVDLVNTTNTIADNLADIFDACADLMLAESVHQAAQGNYERAGGVLTAAGEFEHLPDRFDVIETPRSGTALSQRVLLGMKPPHPAAEGSSPRAILEPGLNNWIADLIGPLDQASCTVTYNFTDAGVDASDSFVVTLDKLSVAPIDLLYVTDNNSSRDFNGRLDLAARMSLLGAHPAAIVKDVTIDMSGAAKALVLLDRLRTLLYSARPATMRDFVPPSVLHGMSMKEIDGIDEDELLLRVLGITESNPARDPASLWAGYDTTLKAFDGIDALDRDDLIKLLLDAANLGVPEALPVLPAASADWPSSLEAQARRVQVLLTARRAALLSKASLEKWSADTPLPPSSDVLRVCREITESLLAGTFPLMPQIKLLNPLSVAALPADVPDPQQAEDWLFQVSFVREGARNLQSARTIAAEVAPGMDAVQVFQWPADQKDWIGAVIPDSVRLSGDLVSLFIQPIGSFDASATVLKGLTIDEWSELVPNTQETTAISFNYDAPGSEPPQTLLLAVSQRQTANNLRWTWQELAGCVEQALTLAKMRAVGPDELRRTLLDAVLPATLLAETAAPATISTSLLGNAFQEIAKAAVTMTQDV